MIMPFLPSPAFGRSVFFFAALLFTVLQPLPLNAAVNTYSADSGDSTPPPQGITVDTVFFDSLAAALRIHWCIDSAYEDQNLQVGITYSLKQFPTLVENAVMYNVFSECTDTIIHFSAPLRFDTIYYVALWLRRDDGSWIAPTGASRATARTGSPFRQLISFFDPDREHDTVEAFNGGVLLWKDAAYTDKTVLSDMLEVIGGDDLPNDCITVGIPFRFINGGPVLQMYVGIRIDSLPDPYPLSRVRMYAVGEDDRYLVDHATGIDSARSLVFVKVTDLNRTFVAMIDTTPPSIEVFSDTSEAIPSDRDVTDTLTISDNIANLRWRYLFGRGDEIPSVREEGELDGPNGSLHLTVSDTMHVISSESGLRALLVVNDGTHSDTVNLSRRVFRSESDRQTTDAEQWTPVFATAELEHRLADSLIERLPEFDTVGYDARYMLLYRWVEYRENRDDESKWVEWNPQEDEIRDLFTLTPGTIVWLKTRRNVPIHLGDGYTLSLRSPCEVKLPPEQWMDFGMPYRFGVSIEDIFAATGSVEDSLLIYQWQEDDENSVYILEPLYTPGLPGKQDQTVPLFYKEKNCYSFYNISSETITLKIPPLPAGSASGKRNAETAWSVVFKADLCNGPSLPPVYCGYAPGIVNNVYPVTPTFTRLTASVRDPKTGKRWGHNVGEWARSGVTREILMTNGSDTVQTVTCRVAQTGAFPRDFSAFLYNPENGKFFSANETEPVSLPPHSSISRLIVAGSDRYRDDFSSTARSRQITLHPLSPNPARSSVTIRYTLPPGSMNRVHIAVYSLLGKRVREWKVNEFANGTDGSIVWDGKDRHGSSIGSGWYVARLTVLNQSGVPVKTLQRGCTWVR
ncbi:MAG: hypothetical protein JW863_03010 [Chitinispirillaceae bacterium]|nr:hypothetical protein [Chitinispirillaceae bacterium]